MEGVFETCGVESSHWGKEELGPSLVETRTDALSIFLQSPSSTLKHPISGLTGTRNFEDKQVKQAMSEKRCQLIRNIIKKRAIEARHKTNSMQGNGRVS